MIKRTINWGFGLVDRHIIIRYVISGGTSAFVNLSLFSLFLYIFQIHYIISSVIAFTFGFLVSLILQKFWTFRDHSTDNIHVQSFLYLLNSLFGLCVNTLVLYISVHYLGFMPLIGQIIAGICTALCTFQISRRYVFNQPTT
ncbi:MAG: GtrA family protein [Candidatus Paceibacterota bacterium]|jgi:putative flippase GtrA